MVLFQKGNKIKKYENIDDIFYDFYDERLLFYEKRIQNDIKKLNEKQKELDQKSKLIQKVIENEIILSNKSNQEILSQLQLCGFSKNDFEVLVNLPLKMLTHEYYSKLLNEIKCIVREIAHVQKIRAKELWEKELKELKQAYHSSHLC